MIHYHWIMMLCNYVGFSILLLKCVFHIAEPTKVPAGDLEHNKILYERVSEIATRKGCTPSQLALAWVHHQGDDVCPSPGTTKIENLNQNIWALLEKPTPEEMAELESIASADAVKGDRYQSITLTWKTSDTPPLASWKAWKRQDPCSTIMITLCLLHFWSVEKLWSS